MPVTSYTTADIVLTERRRFEQPLLLLIWFGAATFCLAEGNFLYLLSCTLGVGVNWIVVRRNMEIYLRRELVNAGVLLGLAIIVLEAQITSQQLLVTVGHFMLLIQLLKLFERKRSRDYVQLLVLNMLLAVTTSLICFSPWFAAALTAYLALACYVTMVFTLKRGLDVAAQATIRGETGPLSPRQVAWNVVRDWPGRPLRRLIWIILLPSFAAAAAAFLLVPRTDDQIAKVLQRDLVTTGLSNTIHLGQPKEIYLSDQIVMHVQVLLHGKPHPPATSSRYLRSIVLDRYEDSTWKNLQGNDRFSQSVSTLPRLSSTQQAECVRHSIRLMGSTQTDLVTPYPTVALTLPPNTTAGISRNLEFLLKNLPRPLGRMNYETLSFPQPLSADQCAFLHGLTPEVDEKAPAGPRVLLPPGSRQRILDLATTWCADLLRRREAQDAPSGRLNLQIAERLAQRLQADYDYTLDLRDADPSRDGVEDFLFYTHQGNCEYFASSLAVMCELLNVPARVAVGFVLDEYDADAERYVVRDRDAHAWCEVLSDSTDWRIVDPTSASARLEYKKRKWYTAFTDFLQEMRFLWYQNVVGYDFVRQREIAEHASDRALNTWGQLRIALTNLKASLVNLLIHGEVDRILVNFMLLLQAITAAVILMFVVRDIQRRRRRRLTPSLSRRLTLLDRLLALLERRGLDLRPEQTLREQAGRAVDRFSLPEAPLRELTELQYRWRWGGRAPTAQELRRAGEAFDFLCEAISARGRT